MYNVKTVIMKLFLHKRFYILSALLFLSCSNIFSQTVWKITALSWGPYVDDKAEFYGRSAKNLSDLLEEKNIKLEVDFFPWKRAKIKAKSIEYIGYFPAWPEELIEGFTASPPLDWSEIGIMKKTGYRLDYSNLNSLFSNYRIGIVNTYIYPDEITEYIKKYPENIDKAPDEVSLLKKLVSGRNDAAITDPQVMKYFADLLNIKGFETAEILMKKELVIAMRDDAENRERIMLLEQILSENIKTK